MEDFFVDDDLFADLNLIGIKQARALQAFDKLPQELSIRWTQSFYGVGWTLDISAAELDELKALARQAYPALPDFLPGDPEAPWVRYAGDDSWQSLYTAPSIERGLVCQEGSISDIKRTRFFRVRAMTFDKYNKRVLSYAEHFSCDRPRVGLKGGPFDQLLMKMRQCIIILSGDPALADVSKYGKRKVDAFMSIRGKLRKLLGENPLNVSVIEDAGEVARIITKILNPNTRKSHCDDMLKKLSILREEFVKTGTVRSVTI